MPRTKKEDAKKYTYRLPIELISSIESIADTESRTVTAQIEVFLRDKVRQYLVAQHEQRADPPQPS